MCVGREANTAHLVIPLGTQSPAMQCISALTLFAFVPHTGGFSISRSVGSDLNALGLKPHYLSVPLDHFSPKTEAWKLKYYVNDSFFQGGGPLVVAMPQEGPLSGDAAGEYMYPYSAPWASAIKPVIVAPEHRFFGDSVPNNDSSVANYRYHTVEQSLKDILALIDHMRATYSSISHVIAIGGSYSGALSAWIRRLYPSKVDAAIAHSPVVSAFMNFPQYGVSNLVAMSSPDSRCAFAFAEAMQAVKRQYKDNRQELLRIFNSSELSNETLGDFNFMYGFLEITAGEIQYGYKASVCSTVERMTQNYTQTDHSDKEWAELIASNFYFARPGPVKVDRPWWWLKVHATWMVQNWPAVWSEHCPF